MAGQQQPTLKSGAGSVASLYFYSCTLLYRSWAIGCCHWHSGPRMNDGGCADTALRVKNELYMPEAKEDSRGTLSHLSDLRSKNEA